MFTLTTRPLNLFHSSTARSHTDVLLRSERLLGSIVLFRCNSSDSPPCHLRPTVVALPPPREGCEGRDVREGVSARVHGKEGERICLGYHLQESCLLQESVCPLYSLAFLRPLFFILFFFIPPSLFHSHRFFFFVFVFCLFVHRLVL